MYDYQLINVEVYNFVIFLFITCLGLIVNIGYCLAFCWLMGMMSVKYRSDYQQTLPLPPSFNIWISYWQNNNIQLNSCYQWYVSIV